MIKNMKTCQFLYALFTETMIIVQNVFNKLLVKTKLLKVHYVINKASAMFTNKILLLKMRKIILKFRLTK